MVEVSISLQSFVLTGFLKIIGVQNQLSITFGEILIIKILKVRNPTPHTRLMISYHTSKPNQKWNKSIHILIICFRSSKENLLLGEEVYMDKVKILYCTIINFKERKFFYSTTWLWEFRQFLSRTSFYAPILIKISMSANIMKVKWSMILKVIT